MIPGLNKEKILSIISKRLPVYLEKTHPENCSKGGLKNSVNDFREHYNNCLECQESALIVLRGLMEDLPILSLLIPIEEIEKLWQNLQAKKVK